MKKCSNVSILFLVLAALKHLESAEITAEKLVTKGPDGSESGEWVYESFSVTAGSSCNEEGENGFKIEKTGRETELMEKYEIFKAAEEEKKLAVRMAELEMMEAEIEAKKAQMEAKKASIEAEKSRKFERAEVKKIVFVKPDELEQIEVIKPDEVKEVTVNAEVMKQQQQKQQEQEPAVKKAAEPAVKQQQQSPKRQEKPVVQKQGDQSDDFDEIEILKVPEEELKVKSQFAVKEQDRTTQVQAKRVIPTQQAAAQVRNSVRLTQNQVQIKKETKGETFYDLESSDNSEASGTETEGNTDSEIEKQDKEAAKLKANKPAAVELKKVKENAVQPNQQQAKPVNLARMSTRVPAASPIVLKTLINTNAPAAVGNPARRTILKQPSQANGNSSPIARKSVTLVTANAKPLKTLIDERKSRGFNFNEGGFDGDDDEDDDFFSPKTGRQTQGYAQQQQHQQQQQQQHQQQQQQQQNFHENQMIMRMSTDRLINPRQSHSQFQPSQHAYEDEQEQGQDLSGIRLGFCEAAVLGAIANIRMMSLKYPRQANSIERKKIAQYIISIIENFPCEKEKEAMKKASTSYPPIYTERRSFNKWAIQFTRTVLRETKCPVGLSMSSLLIPLKKKK